MFGRQSVIDGDHNRTRVACNLTAHDVVCIEISNHPAAAMKEHEGRQDAHRWSVDTQRNRPVFAVCLQVANVWKVWSRRPQRRARLAILPACFRRRQLVDWRKTKTCEVLHNLACLRID